MPGIHRALGSAPPWLRRALKSVPGATALRDRSYGQPGGPRPPKGSPRPVVYLPTWLEWDAMRQRPQYLLEALAGAGHQVWFVDPRLAAARDAGDRIHLVPSLEPVPRSGVILYTHFAPTRALVDRFDDAVVVYDLLDDLTIYDDDERGLPERVRVRGHHAALVHDADVVIASNPVLADRHRGERPDLLLVENGVDLERFTPDGRRAPELAGGGPIAGFHGAIAPWLDVDLLDEVVRLRPGIRFVLVGPVDPRAASGFARLRHHPNLAHLPEQSPDRIPEFVRGFDAGLVPFVVDDLTRGVTPLKMFEYLASGVPVVATPLPACRGLAGVETATDAPGFADALDRALASSDPSGVRARATGASWDARVGSLLDHLNRQGRLIVS